VTTLMASPIFELVYHRLSKPQIAVAPEPVA